MSDRVSSRRIGFSGLQGGRLALAFVLAGPMMGCGGEEGAGGGPLFPPMPITSCEPGAGLTPEVRAGPCEISLGSADLLIVADILTPTGLLRAGQVRVVDGRIDCVGCECAGDTGEPPSTSLLCLDSVLSPGLINAHDHVTFLGEPLAATEERYEHRHDWREGLDGHTRLDTVRSTTDDDRVRWHELRQLLSGTTSVFGSVGPVARPSGLLRNLDRADLLEGLDAEPAVYETFPLSDRGGVKRTTCGYGARTPQGSAAFLPHLAEGIDAAARNEMRCTDGVGRGDDADYLDPRVAIVQGIGLDATDLGRMAASGVELIWSPRSNLSLYGDTAPVSAAAHAGVTIGLGTDWVHSGSMNMLRELKCADAFNRRNLGGFFPDSRLWLMATRGNAQALGVESLGAMVEGAMADLVMYSALRVGEYRAVLDAGPEDVELVLRGGEVMFGDAPLVEALRPGCDPVEGPGFDDVCGSEKRVCLAETGVSFGELRAEMEDEYALFFCGDPPAERACVPAREHRGDVYPDARENGSTYYDGRPRPTDPDGDGIPSESDNCPEVFNPVRPLDDGAQSDVDGDGIGDACDPR